MIKPDSFSTLERQSDLLRVGARGDDEVILKLALIAVENQVDAVIDSRKPHFTESLDVGKPLGWIIPAQIVHPAVKLLFVLHLGRRIRPYPAHTKYGFVSSLT